MPTSNVVRRARLRQIALREPYGKAMRELLAASPASPVFPPAKYQQALLEGAIFSETRTLLYQRRPDSPLPSSSSGYLEVRQLQPTSTHLDIEVGPEGAASTLGNILARHEEPAREYVQAAGLRLRAAGRSAEFYRPGSLGAVRFHGVSAREVMAAHRQVCPAGTCIAELSPHRLTHDELKMDGYIAGRALAALSSAVRRLGMFRAFHTTSVDSWSWLAPVTPDAIVVEAWFPSMSGPEQNRLLSLLCAKELSPRWAVDPSWPRERKELPSRYLINVDGAADIQLRLLQS